MTIAPFQEWDGPDVLECFEALADRPYTLFFDSNRPSHPLNKWSFICWDPVEIIETKDSVIKHNHEAIDEKNFFSFLQSRLDAYKPNKSDAGIPFSGGAAGYLAYDLGRQIETLPHKTKDDLNLPDACIGIYQNVLAFDLENRKAYLAGQAPDLNRKTAHNHPPYNIEFSSDISDEDYLLNINKVIEEIHAGEVYQINISRRFKAELPKDFNSADHYKYLRQINAAPFSAYMNLGDHQLASCSPERFLHLKKNEVETRPIKGTIPSHLPPKILTESTKDRAENTMIVDLLRNDLSKVCDFHSVKVPSLCQLETFEGLHHLVSIVKGTLLKDKRATDLLKACFPGGSITGAPKIRAMEIIEELEPTCRGPYCGAMGYIDFNGTMDTNIAIRTLIYKNGKVYLQTGSGIVSDSVPEKELQEGLDKAQKIFESFQHSMTEDVA